jgi:hypothetical protein
MRVQWELTELRTSDGQLARGRFGCLVQALENPTEQKMLREALLGSRRAVGSADVVAHFGPSIQTAARRQAGRISVETLLSESGREDLQMAMVTAARAVAFVSGVELRGPFLLEVDCPALRREAEQTGRVRAAAELLAQFQAFRAAGPELSPGQILARMGPADQAEMLKSLLMAAADGTTAKRLWAVAGPGLFEIGEDLNAGPRAIAVPQDLGPLRSVRGDGDGGLLLGCRAGVIRYHESDSSGAKYFDPSISTQSGFNAAVISQNRLWATHAEIGVACWDLDQPKTPRLHAQISPGAGRNLVLLESGEPILSSGPRILTVSEDGTTKSFGSEREADILGLFVRAKEILAVRADGSISIFDSESFEILGRQHRAKRLSAAGALPWLGDSRLLLAEESGGILCVGLEDEVCTQYSSGHVGCRIVAGSEEKVAAVSADRQRLIVWNSWDGRQPAAEIHLGSLAKHRIADIAFI